MKRCALILYKNNIQLSGDGIDPSDLEKSVNPL